MYRCNYNIYLYIYAVLPPTIAKLVIISSILVNYGLFIGTVNKIRSGGGTTLSYRSLLRFAEWFIFGHFPSAQSSNWGIYW